MTDYRAEQDGEFEALSSIYSDELQSLSEEPRSFQISISASGQDSDDHIIDVAATLCFTYTETYPDERPIVEVSDFEGITEEQATGLIEAINEQADENLGMVMVFTLVSAGQEQLESIIDSIKKNYADEKNRIEMERRREDEKRFHGTTVTLENFLAWRIRFNQETGSDQQIVPDEINKKLTGRQLFERDDTLKDSDAQFYADTVGVKVDESLFQDLDDLDIDDEEIDS